MLVGVFLTVCKMTLKGGQDRREDHQQVMLFLHNEHWPLS